MALFGKDVMCCAQTGSGKTCAFLVPVLSKIDINQATGAVGCQVGTPAQPKAVILAPTRELCSQIHLEALKLTFASPIRCSEIYGGVDAKPQLKELAQGVDVVTVTPGRMTDFIDREVLSCCMVEFLVLDEADRMLDMGFEPQIRQIVQQRDMPSCQQGRKTAMFSATFPKDIQKLARDFLRDYVWVGVGRVGGAVETVTHKFVHVGEWQKMQALQKALTEQQGKSTIVFVGMKRTAAKLDQDLNRGRFKAVSIHGDMEQPQREASLAKFKSGAASILVATDVAARGLDIPDVLHVIQYDLPQQAGIDDYVHRVGRTGRVGKKGLATSFIVTEGKWATPMKTLKDLVKLLADDPKPMCPELQKVAREMNIQIPTGGAGKGGFKGGGDARGGQSRVEQVKAGQTTDWSKGSGKGEPPNKKQRTG